MKLNLTSDDLHKIPNFNIYAVYCGLSLHSCWSTKREAVITAKKLYKKHYLLSKKCKCFFDFCQQRKNAETDVFIHYKGSNVVRIIYESPPL